MRESISRKDILTPQEAADLLAVSTDTIYEMCNAGQLPFIKCGNRRRIPGWRLIEILENCGNGKTALGGTKV